MAPSSMESFSSSSSSDFANPSAVESSWKDIDKNNKTTSYNITKKNDRLCLGMPGMMHTPGAMTNK
jgi:hypothetical protein